MTKKNRKVPAPSAATQHAAYVKQQEKMAQNHRDVTQRLIAAYLAESDRDYAEEFYGSMLIERGVNLEEIRNHD